MIYSVHFRFLKKDFVAAMYILNFSVHRDASSRCRLNCKQVLKYLIEDYSMNKISKTCYIAMSNLFLHDSCHFTN